VSEREPDPAALDELSRAFGDEHPGEGVRIVPRTAPAVDLPERAPGAHGPAASETSDDLDPTAPTPVEPFERDADDHETVPQPDREPGSGPAPGAARVIIADDELPDAVYVEGSLDGSGRSGGIVIIEDDDTGDALKPESERDLRRGIEPRLRERRIAVKRAQGRKRLIWVGVALGVVVLVVVILAVLGSSLFAIQEDDVTVTGNVYTDPEAMQDVIDDLVGTPTLLADTQRAEQRLERIPWVDEAKVTVRFPHSASIEIREREALSTYQAPDGRYRVLDRDGRVLDVLDKYPLAYVLIDGPDPVDLDAGQFAPFGYAAASELAKNLTASVRGRVDRIDVTADGSRLALLLDDGTEVRFGEARDLLNKLVRLETVLDQIAREQAAGTVVDDGVPDAIDVSTAETTR